MGLIANEHVEGAIFCVYEAVEVLELTGSAPPNFATQILRKRFRAGCVLNRKVLLCERGHNVDGDKGLPRSRPAFYKDHSLFGAVEAPAGVAEYRVIDNDLFVEKRVDVVPLYDFRNVIEQLLACPIFTLEDAL